MESVIQPANFGRAKEFVNAWHAVARPQNIQTKPDIQMRYRELTELLLPKTVPVATLTAGVTAEDSDDKEETRYTLDR